MTSHDIFAHPKTVTDIRDCEFYHAMQLPGHEFIPGGWDLRPGLDRYLGHVDFSGKTVLDVGAANGFLTFNMEQRGAQVISYDLPAQGPWDLVPFAGSDLETSRPHVTAMLRRIQNGYWYCHRHLKSDAKMVYGNVYRIPQEIGDVDIATVGSILLHLRDPFLALEQICRRVRETVIVSEVLSRRQFIPWGLNRILGGRLSCLFGSQLKFLPDARHGRPTDTWWSLPPSAVSRYLAVLGMESIRVVYHCQWLHRRRHLMYTVVARRTRPAAATRSESHDPPRPCAA